MKENICSIPINDVFLPKDGCPMCRMRDMLEQRKAEYITGSAMMEPNVRIKTNEQGFCYRHFAMMVKLGKRLSNALILESHLQKNFRGACSRDSPGQTRQKETCRSR